MDNAIKQAAEQYKGQAEGITALQQTLISGFSGVGDGLASSLLKGENAFNSLGNVALNVLDRIASAMIQMSVVNPLLNSVFSLSGGQALPTFGGFRAAGGPVASGMAYIVGEKGPELFMPKGSGTIIPNHAMAAPRLRP